MASYDVYLSYRQAERKYEQLLLCDALLARGATVFSDCIQGVPTLAIMEAAVPASRLFVFFASPTSLESKYIRYELQRAVSSGRPLLCIVAAGFDVGAWARAGEAANAELPLEKAQLDAVVECAKRGVVLRCNDDDGAGLEGVVQRVCQEVEAGGGRLFLSQVEALGGPLTPAHLERCAGGALPLAHRADAASRLAEAAKHRDTYLLRAPPRSAQEVHLLLLSGPFKKPTAGDHPLRPSVFLKRALKQRCPDLNVELLPWDAPVGGARAAVRAARVVFALLGEPFFEGGAEGARAAFSEALCSKKKLAVFTYEDAMWKVARDGEGLPPGWSAEVEIRRLDLDRCGAREASLAEMLDLAGAMRTQHHPKVGVTLAGIKRVLSSPALFPKRGCDNLMGKEVYARLAFALKGHFGEAAVDTKRPFVEIPGLFEPGELGESTCLATYNFDQPFSTALATMEAAPPGAFLFLDPFCLSKYSARVFCVVSWRAHVRRHHSILVALPWSFDPPSASWTLRRKWKLAEIALASVEGRSVLFSSPVVSSVARTRIDEVLAVTDLLAMDFDAVWALCSEWALSTSIERGNVMAPLFDSLFPDAAGSVKELDGAVKDRVLGELHAYLCAQAEAAVQQLEGRSDAMATHRLPLAYARLLLQPCGRLGGGGGGARAVQLRDAALAERFASDAARAEQLCDAALKARAARWAAAAARGDAAAAAAAGADALFAAASLAAAGAARGGGACNGGSGWSRVVGALPPALAAAFGAVLEPSAALRGAASSEGGPAFAAAGGGDAQKRARAAAAPSEAAGAPPPSSLPPFAGTVFKERNRKALQSLEKDLRSGSVVLFTGAGLFGPTKNERALPKELALPDWKTLMLNLVSADETLPVGVRAGLKALLESQSSGAAEYEMVAQQLEDAMTQAVYEKTLKKMLAFDPSTHGGVMKRTFALIQLLPFRALLTTNFTRTHTGHDASMLAEDGIPRANIREFVSPRACWSVEKSLAAQLALVPDAPAAAVELRREEKLLRCAFDTPGLCDPSKPLPSLDPRFDARLLHLHGTQKVVSSRRSYRELLYSNSNILPFLRTLAATSKFLFIGYSLSDAYLCEILQETLALLAPPGEAAKRPCLGYFFQWCCAKEGEDFYSEALLARLDYRRKHQGLRTVLSMDASVELQALLGASKEVRFARSFEGVRVLALAPLDPASRFEEAALAVASLAFAAAAAAAAGAASDGVEFAAAERAFRQQRDDFSALSAALGRLQLPPPAARPQQWLPLPRGGSFLICFSVDQLKQALAAGAGGGEPWTVLLSDWRLEKTVGGSGGVLRGLRLGAAHASLPALAFITSGHPSGGGGGGGGAAAVAVGARNTEEWEAMSLGYLRLCRGFEELLSALSELLQKYNPTST